MNSIYIYGASGHGLVVADIAKACGYDDIIYIDDGDNDYATFKDIKDENNIPIAFGIGNNSIRAKLFQKVKQNGFKIVTLIHPSSIISSTSSVGLGTVVMPNVVVNANTTIGDGVILNTGCIVEHECIIEDFVHISPNVALAGDIKVGSFTHVGISSCVIQGIKIGKNCIIGAGTVIIRNIEDNKKMVGNPAKELIKA